MFKDIIFNIIVITVLTLATGVDTIYPCDKNVLTEQEEIKYDSMCPYGDAVILFKGTTQNKRVDCVNFDSQKVMWETKSAPTYCDLINGKKVCKEYYRPDDVKVYTEDGLLSAEQAEADIKIQNVILNN